MTDTGEILPLASIMCLLWCHLDKVEKQRNEEVKLASIKYIKKKYSF